MYSVIQGTFIVIFFVLFRVSLTVQAQECTLTRADVVFVMDESSSIPERSFNKQKDFVKEMIRKFDIGADYTRVGLVTFSTGATLKFSLKSYTEKDDIFRAVDHLRQHGGETDTGEALRITREYVLLPYMGSRRGEPDIPQICIVITDGNSQLANQTKLEAARTRAEGIIIFAIGVGDQVSMQELRNIASGEEYVLHVDDYDKLGSIELTLNHKTCEVTKPPPTIHTTTTPTIPTTTTITTTTTAAPTPPPLYVTPGCKNKKADVVVLLDTSSGIRAPDFAEMVAFVQALAYTLDISPNRTRMSLITFADNPMIHFEFNQYATREEIADAASRIKKQRGSRNLDSALKVIRTHSFDPSFGARKKVTKVVILVTDGPAANLESALTERRALMKEHGAEMVAIGVGTSVPDEELHSLVGPRGVFRLYDHRQLKTLRYSIADKMCEIEPPPQDFGCGERTGADLVFIMDTQNAGSNDIITASNFLKSVVRKFEVGKDKIQISTVPSECRSVKGFDLDSHKTREGVLEALETQKQYSLVNLLEQVRAETFQPQHGGRSRDSVRRVAILVTDEKPSNMRDIRKKSESLKLMGVDLYVIGVGDLVSEGALREIASRPLGRHLFRVDSYETLAKNQEGIVGALTTYICRGL